MTFDKLRKNSLCLFSLWICHNYTHTRENSGTYPGRVPLNIQWHCHVVTCIYSLQGKPCKQCLWLNYNSIHTIRPLATWTTTMCLNCCHTICNVITHIKCMLTHTQDHVIKVCPNVEIPCDLGCGAVFLRCQYQQHTLECMKQTTLCSYCSESVTKDELEKHIKEICSESPMACDFCLEKLEKRSQVCSNLFEGGAFMHPLRWPQYHHWSV